MSSASIPLGDAPLLRQRASLIRRTRFLAATVALGAAVLCLLLAFRWSPTRTTLLPPGSTGVVVLDASASISPDTYARIAGTLNRLIASKGAYGLVLFSDTAYQALPPRTPARELKPIVRFFEVPEQTTPGALPESPRSPWTDSFGGGTRISTGLTLALDVIRADKIANPAVVLVSDLDDDADDLDRLSQIAIAYRRAGIPLNVVGLNAAADDEAFIRKLVRGTGTFTPAPLPSESSAPAAGRADRSSIVASLLVAIALTLLLFLTSPLRWGTS